jgi:hypothetical protein
MPPAAVVVVFCANAGCIAVELLPSIIAGTIDSINIPNNAAVMPP